MHEVRGAYRALRDRALAAHPPDATYVQELWSVWDLKLAQWPGDTEMPSAVPILTRSMAESNAVLEWLDAYPDAVVDRLPGGLFAEPRPRATEDKEMK